jgi:hypothetical protein
LHQAAVCVILAPRMLPELSIRIKTERGGTSRRGLKRDRNDEIEVLCIFRKAFENVSIYL